jgi:hypothetical protein
MEEDDNIDSQGTNARQCRSITPLVRVFPPDLHLLQSKQCLKGVPKVALLKVFQGGFRCNVPDPVILAQIPMS